MYTVGTIVRVNAMSRDEIKKYNGLLGMISNVFASDLMTVYEIQIRLHGRTITLEVLSNEISPIT
jgi:hypothetical protein